MSWGEAFRLAQRLAADPSSAVGAALAGWDHPASREALILMDLYDAFTAANFKRAKPYPRPWPDRDKKRTKPGEGITQDQIIAALRAAGHTKALPGVA